MECQHAAPTVQTSIFYCLSLSFIFVGSLYVLEPQNVRRLERDAIPKIKWRSFAVLVTCVISIWLYYAVFCIGGSGSTDKWNVVSFWDILGWSTRWRDIAGVLAHTALLYLGPIVVSTFQVHEGKSRLKRNGQDVSYLQVTRMALLDPLVSSLIDDPEERWLVLRNLVFAPFSEEIVFRGCMVPSLLSAGISTRAVTFIVPLFFGTAHFHHALTKLQDGNRVVAVVLSTFFQFAYTFLFGSYAAHAFIRTGSILAVAASHSFCNFMGLPDFGFFRPHGARLSRLYPYRWILLVAYLTGVLCFIWGTISDKLLPARPRLVEIVDGAILKAEDRGRS